MPTASIKAEKVKQPSLEASEPLRQGIIIVEHKIRNLEKRKTKLDSYKDLQASGKELNSDQLTAVQKYDEVIQTLEFAKDLCKQLNTLAVDSAKALKKQLRKEAAEKLQQEIARTKEILIIQDVLSNMGQDQVREDLTEGKSKVTVTAEELSQIDLLYVEISPKQEDPPLPYLSQFQNPAEQMTSLLEGKNKEAFGTTYAALKSKLMEIANSGYFDPTQPEDPTPVAEVPQPEEPVVNNVPVTAPVEELTDPAIVTTIAPSETSLPVMQEVSHLESQLIQQQQAAAAAQAAQHHLNVFKSGPIDFIQDNEVEEPENDNSIPTLTYTNQNYTPSKSPQAQPPQQPANDEWTDDQPVEQTPQQPAQQEDDGWEENNDNGGWQETNHWQTQTHHHNNNQHQNNDGFIQAGGGRGRGGRGRGGRGGPRPQQSNRPNRGGYNRENREGGYNREGGNNYYNRDGYNKREGGEGQNFYQNGYRGGGGERRGGSNRNFSDKGERGGGGRGGPRGRGSNPNYRGGFRQQQ